MVWWLEMDDFSSQGHLEHLAYVVRMAIFFAKIRPFHFPISNFFACGAQKLDLAYVYVVSVAVGGGYVWTNAQSAVALNINLGHIGSTRVRGCNHAVLRHRGSLAGILCPTARAYMYVHCAARAYVHVHVVTG